MAKIDAMELSDMESPNWATKKEGYAQLIQKRYMEIENAENVKRKVRVAPIRSILRIEN